MDISINTPALLFPAVTLLMLAYTNRFNTLATIIRNLQIYGVLSLLLCMVSMFAFFAGWAQGGQWCFASALVLMIISMMLSLRELQVSIGALDLLLMDIEKKERSK